MTHAGAGAGTDDAAGPARARVVRGADRPLRVLHLDHTNVSGGAEFALLRMLRAEPPWSPYLLLAATPGRSLGTYEALPSRIPRAVAGVRQPAGVTAGGVGAALSVGARVLVQAASVRTSRAFRSADLVDANTARAAAYGALAARTSRVPFIVHLRDLVEVEALGRAGYELMVRVVLPRADGVIANSRATLESARPHLRRGALAEVIPSASGLRVGRRAGVEAASTGGPISTIGMLARIDPWKGQHLLLEAFARVFRGRDVRLQFAGDAPFGHESHVERLRHRASELGLAAQVDFLGHIDDVETLLAGWDVAVQASTRAEPLGQNVLQYLASGRVVVAADEGGPAEWIVDGGNGLLVAPRDVDALAAALGRLDADDDLRRRLSIAAAATPGLLDDEAVALAHAAFYEAVVRARRGA